jgi:hypothetical protein
MAQAAQPLPVEASSLGSDIAGIPAFLIDPQAAAKRVRSKTFWIVPLILSCLVTVVAGIYMKPIAMHAAAVSAPPDGMTSEQFAKQMEMGMKIGVYVGPVFVVIFTALTALVLFGTAAMVGASAKFGQMFNLVVGCGMIQLIGQIAGALVLHFKGEVNSMAELKPALGLDIFMSEGTSKYLMALGSMFSVFQIWWMVMMVLIFAAAFKVSKTKSLIAVLPVWLMALGFTLLGAVFQR